MKTLKQIAEDEMVSALTAAVDRAKARGNAEELAALAGTIKAVKAVYVATLRQMAGDKHTEEFLALLEASYHKHRH